MNLSIFLIYLLFSFLNITLCALHSKEEWKSRSIYQIITDRFATSNEEIKSCADYTFYCGGDFKGIIQQLDYISGMGFGALWISPPFKNKEGQWRYHGYHNIDIYTVNPHFGSEEDLINLISECHKRDIWVILDAVPNHMADGSNEDILTYIPFNKPEYYHNLVSDGCNDDDDKKDQYHLENCDPWGLKDLKQENEFVFNTLIKWLNDTIKKFDFDGVRYADVVNAPKWFWGNFTLAAGTYTLGIVSKSDVENIVDYQNYMDGVGDYPLYHTMQSSFCEGSMKSLDNYIQNEHKKYISPQYNGIWFSNHDNERFLYKCSASSKKAGLRNGIIFTLFFEGVPIFYYGDEQYCEKGGEGDRRREELFGKYNNTNDLYNYIKIANQVRKEQKIYEKDFKRRYADDNFYAFSRGDVLIAVGNGKTGTIIITRHGLNEGEKLCNKLKDNDCITVTNDELQIGMDGEPKIFVKAENVEKISENGAGYLNLFLYLILFLFL